MVGNNEAAKLLADRIKHGSQKPWKQKKKASSNGEAVFEVEIFEGKPPSTRPSSLELTSVESGYVRILCMGDYNFLVPLKVVETFKCVDVILHSEVSFKERLENIIRFPDMSPQVMEAVLRFVFTDYVNKLKMEKYLGVESPRLVFQFEVAPEQVMALIHASHFLGVQHLLSMASTMVAHNLKDVPDLSSLPPDLAWCIAEQFSAEDLFNAEERPDFLSLNLDTKTLWEIHCKKLLQGDIIQPVSSCSAYSAYDAWDANQELPPSSWKSLYITSYLQQLADRQTGCDNERFMDEVSHKGNHVYCHSVRPLFWDWVINNDLAFFLTFAASFKNLSKLCLVKLPLGTASKAGVLPCSRLRELLQSLPVLQYLDISEAGISAEGAFSLSKGLIQHTRIQVLRMAFNDIETQGFIALALVLASIRTLKVLDVRENSIGAWVPQNVIDALEEACLEELLFEGNFRSENEFRYTTPQALHAHRSTEEESHHSGDIFISLKVLITSGLPRTLRHLQLSQCKLTDVRVNVLAKALSSLSNIQKLDLMDNMITSKGATVIAHWMQENGTLLELRLDNNNITDSCALAWSDAISRHTRLQKFSLLRNYTYGESNLNEVLNAAVERGLNMQQEVNSPKFSLDLRSTDISHGMRERVLRDERVFKYVDLKI